MNNNTEGLLECPMCDTECEMMGTLRDTKKTDIFFCYECKNFFGIPDDGDIYGWSPDRSVVNNFEIPPMTAKEFLTMIQDKPNA